MSFGIDPNGLYPQATMKRTSCLIDCHWHGIGEENEAHQTRSSFGFDHRNWVGSSCLLDRGGGLIYDDVLNVTWLQDANYAKTSGYDADGQMTWTDANAWAASLVYGGFSDWRLPTVMPMNGLSYNYTYKYDGSSDVGPNVTSRNSEMAYMFFVNLGNPSYYTLAGQESGCYSPGTSTCLDFTGAFTNLRPDGYWYGTNTTPVLGDAWDFNMASGSQQWSGYSANLYAWGVRDGDVAVSPVPAPPAYLLMLTGLGIVGLAKKFRKAV